MVKWSYRTLSCRRSDWDSFDEKLNEWGNEGWEVVSCAAAGDSSDPDRIYVVLKLQVRV